MIPAEPELDIVVPVYNEGGNILRMFRALERSVRTPVRVLICYDHDEDTTLTALRTSPPPPFEVRLVKNQGQGVLGAIKSGLASSTAPAVLVMPADDDYNAPRLDAMVARFRQGNDIVVASRYVRGGAVGKGPFVKTFLCRCVSWAMRHLVRLPTHDATNGFRLFSRRVIDGIPIESTAGFSFSLELTVKCHRRGWPIAEVPVEWHERTEGTSRFRVFRWAPHYLKWVRYALATQLFGLAAPRAAAPAAAERAAVGGGTDGD
jgi:glycosyltransferase involved in cell wall biosynthesis